MTAFVEKRPRGRWSQERPPEALRAMDVVAMSAWSFAGIMVVSVLENAELPDGTGVGPQWHVSVSARGGRPSRAELRRALADFGMSGAEEDNHHPGIARHFWRPVDAVHRVACQCKTTETTVVDGAFRWSNPTSGPCRGCELERLTGRACPLHTEARSA